MPVISIFFGIIIRMPTGEHEPQANCFFSVPWLAPLPYEPLLASGNGASMIRERFPASDPDYHVVERLKALDVRR